MLRQLFQQSPCGFTPSIHASTHSRLPVAVSPDACGDSAPMTPVHDVAGLLKSGSSLHLSGSLEEALIVFEKALALAPQDVNVRSACATVLTELSRPEAAYATLLGVEQQLLESADGTINLAIAAENCQQLDRALALYRAAIQLDPGNLRALNNIAILAAASNNWDVAVEHARRCVDLQPGYLPFRTHLVDFLCGARNYPEALRALALASATFAGERALRIRLVCVEALSGHFKESQSAWLALGEEERLLYRRFLSDAHLVSAGTEDSVCRPQLKDPDAWQLYAAQAFNALEAGDWRDSEELTRHLRSALEAGKTSGAGQDWRDAQFYGTVLGLDEDELAAMRKLSIAHIVAHTASRLPAFVHRGPPPGRKDDRIQIGLAVRGLNDARNLHALKRQLAAHDGSRFALHVYSPTRHPDPAHAEALSTHGVQLVETAHFSDMEFAARVRLDRLDLFMDMTFNTGWCRPEVAAIRVAPVQLRHLTWHRHHAPGPWEYSLSDRFVHPDGLDMAGYGEVVRLPHSCWLAAHDETTSAPPPSREALGLPGEGLLLCAGVHPAKIDPLTFRLWMKILRSLPDALLWLPRCDALSANHLRREADAAGVGRGRLLFGVSGRRTEALEGMKHVDLFLDSLRFNANIGMEDAMRLGVPAITLAGDSMASRMGGSILQAAGYCQGIFSTPEAYVAEAIRLGRDPALLGQRKAELQAAAATAPLFDLASRVQELERAWEQMVSRSRAGLAPVAFDVAPRERLVVP
jgi:protein O-GlcNAc transferase